MTRRLVVIRPEPGNGHTAARARALGWEVEAMPLFAVAPVAWTPPDPARFDALLLTSANAVRHGGPGLDAVKALPVVAVGAATAAAARAAGFRVVLTGEADAGAVSAEAGALGHARLLHLAGRDRIAAAGAITIYASDALPPPDDLSGRVDDAVVLLHSARAARTLAALVADRRRTAIAALSEAVRAAAGPGWRAAAVAAKPTDAALLAAAAALAD